MNNPASRKQAVEDAVVALNEALEVAYKEGDTVNLHMMSRIDRGKRKDNQMLVYVD